MAATAPTSDDILGQSRFSSSAGSSRYSAEAPTADSILGGMNSIDPAALHPLAGLIDNKDLDYLALDDDKLSGVEGGKTVLPSRGFGDELCYGTGSTYLFGQCLRLLGNVISGLMVSFIGLAAGGLWGLREGLRKDVIPRNTATATPLAAGTTAPAASAVGAQATAFANTAAAKAAPTAAAAAATATPEAAAAGTAAQAQARRISRRLRWNNVLNQVTRRGSFTGNSAGVLALIYNGFNSSLDAYRGGYHDIYGSMFAGACTGALWRCTGKLRQPDQPSSQVTDSVSHTQPE